MSRREGGAAAGRRRAGGAAAGQRLLILPVHPPFSSSTLNYLSNRYGWATSSTHALIGALVGVGIASGAGVEWGYVVRTTNGAVTAQNGLGAVVASFVISPVLAGLLSATIFALVKYGILLRRGIKSYQWAMISAPFIYAAVAAFEAWCVDARG